MSVKTAYGRYRDISLLILGFVGLFIVFHFLTGGRFFTESNLRSLLTQPVSAAFLGWGIFLIFTSGVIDMSVGANVLLSANVGAMAATDLGLGYPGMLVASMVCSIVLATLTMAVCLRLRLPSWISSLGMAMIYESLLNFVSVARSGAGAAPVPSLLFEYRALGRLPWCVIILAVGFVAAHTIFTRTSIGLSVRAMGSNLFVAENMGLKRNRTLFISAIIGGAFIGIAAAIYISYSGTVRPVSGLTSVMILFRPIAAWMLALSFGRLLSIPTGILVFTFFITAIFNFLTFMGAPTGTIQEIALGILVILVAAIAKKGYRGVVK